MKRYVWFIKLVVRSSAVEAPSDSTSRFNIPIFDLGTGLPPEYYMERKGKNKPNIIVGELISPDFLLLRTCCK